jgi:hypothetical protein
MAAKFNCALLVVLLLLMPSLPIAEAVNLTPAVGLVATQVDDNGYEWIVHDNKNWYRTTGSQSEWIEFNN